MQLGSQCSRMERGYGVVPYTHSFSQLFTFRQAGWNFFFDYKIWKKKEKKYNLSNVYQFKFA